GGGFRGYDGIKTIAAAIERAGKAEPDAIRQALWDVKVKGAGSDIAFEKEGPAGKESGQSHPRVYLVKIEGGKVITPQ
ncbi:ABC transporter substrate-binding protein, partial [Mesorhizobium sp. M7A.F.Ca.US.006.01.1.1]